MSHINCFGKGKDHSKPLLYELDGYKDNVLQVLGKLTNSKSQVRIVSFLIISPHCEEIHHQVLQSA